MVPRQLSEWTLAVATDLLGRGVFELEHFDFKERLPDSRNDEAKEGLRLDCCAFANSDGGFLVFGIDDERRLPAAARLVGIDANLDFPAQFGNFPSACSPSVWWDFRNPPIALPSGRVLHVVHIPKSWNGPHAAGSRDAGWRFMKRTNKGNEGMAIDEVRSAFLGYYEKRLKLQLLRAELVMVIETAKGGIIPIEKFETTYSYTTFELRVVETVLADTYSITAELPALLQALGWTRRIASLINIRQQSFLGTVDLSIEHIGLRVRTQNEFMARHCEQLIRSAETALSELNTFLADG